jgi:peptidoglycan hydrolase-like protein with peptidoglycan-binding domain
MSNHKGRILRAVLSLAMVMGLVVPALGQRVVTVPGGTVIALRMETYLSSDSSRVGDRFTATVFRSAVVDGRVVVPENTKVDGHVTGATTADRGNRTGMLSVAFDRMVFSAGSSVQIDGTLTTLSEEGRRKIEQEARYQEGGGPTRPAVVFLGAGGGAGATIGVAGGRAETTSVGTILGTILGNSDKAEVRPGTEFGMMVERSFTVNTSYLTDDRDSDNDTRTPPQTVLTSADNVRSAQIALRSRNYYNGQANGVMSQATRDAISNFQHDRHIASTGELDIATARALGIPVKSITPPINDLPQASDRATSIGNPRQIALLANRLLQDFQRELNMRSTRGQVSFDARRDFRPNEVEVLFQITTLQAAAELYNQLTASITDPDAVKGAAGGLMRQARLLERIMRRDTQLRLSSTVNADWQQLQGELARINVTDANLDADAIR